MTVAASRGSWSDVTRILSAPANASFVGKQFYGARLNSSGKLALATIAGQRITGVVQDPVAVDINTPYAVEGVTKVVLAGTVSEDDRLMVGASGTFVKGTGGGFCVGRALTDGVSGDVIPMLITFEGYIPVWNFSHTCDLAGITSGSVDAMALFIPAYPKWRIERFTAVVNVAATTGSKDASFNLLKNATALLGTLSLTSANCTPKGAVAATTAITETTAGDADAVAADSISINSVTVSAAFSEGSVVFHVRGSLGDA